MFEGLLGSRSVLPSASVFSPYSLLVFFFWVSPLQSSCLSLSTGFLHFFLPCSADFICKNESKDRKAVPAGLWFFVFPALSPFFFLLLCLVFCVFFLSLSGNWDGWRQRYCSFYVQPMVIASRTLKTMATPVDDLCSFSFLLLMLSVEMMRETAMKTCYASWVHAPTSVFFCFWQWRSAFFFFRSSLFSFLFFSLLFPVLFLSFFHPHPLFFL